ncbi:hypothetical protein RvY_16446-2 [Ramazzottius varieornatus]|uniref:glutathione transferase n=1 Tax=Ramazzottius varieornatus TaxID=947166 RepID=A0A1D1W616_RAMVA|nr:hypothetical protein RvY_16446-2 [Ramazzottius varieornatus]
MAPMTLGYWDCRGLVQPIRYLLEHVGQEYDYKCYTFGNDIDTMFSSWYSQKPTIELDFPNLPYLIDGDIRLTETVAILHHLGRKFELVAQSDLDQRTQDMFDGILNDLASAGTTFYYPDRRSRQYPDDLRLDEHNAAFSGLIAQYSNLSRHHELMLVRHL